jgi:hypothetical protein
VNRVRLSLISLALALALVALPASAARAQYPGIPWTELLPPFPSPTEPQPGPVPNCRKPSMRCIDVEVRRLRRLRDRLGCDHRAVFATTYLTLTKELRDMLRENPDLVKRPRYLFIEDALFANVYFDTTRAWNRGEAVPAAWRIAFKAAERGNITGAQDMLLGINAHVQNDMPFVLAALGLRAKDGASRKRDHDRLNAVLARAYEPVVRAVGSRYDPTISLTNASWHPIDDIVGLEAVRAWREVVWRNAERLVNARNNEQRARIAAHIEGYAGLTASLIAAVPVPGHAATRDAYCRSRVQQP